MQMNSEAIKILAAVLLLGAVMGLAWICQPHSDSPISVSLATSQHLGNHEKAKIVLKAGLNGNGVSHGKVTLELTPTAPGSSASLPNQQWCIEGFTDAHGVFISNWTPGPPGEYMVTASVKKLGYIDGQTVCFLRVGKN
jgi:hypothetical protein